MCGRGNVRWVWLAAGGGNGGSVGRRAAARQLLAGGDDGEGGDDACGDGVSGGRGWRSRRGDREVEDEQW